MKLGYLFLTIAFFAHCHFSLAQSSGTEDRDSNQSGKGKEAVVKEDLQISIATSFTTGLGNNNYYSVINPGLRLPVSDRFSVYGGLLMERGNLFMPYMRSSNGVSGSGNRTSINLGGAYAISKRLTFSGYGSMTIDQPMTSGENQSQFAQNRNQSFRFNLDYQVSDNVSFQAGFEYGNRLNRFNRGGMLRRQPDPLFRNNGLGTPAQFSY